MTQDDLFAVRKAKVRSVYCVGFRSCSDITPDEQGLIFFHFVLGFVSIAVADLAAREDKPLEGFGLFGVVKEVGVDDEGMHI